MCAEMYLVTKGKDTGEETDGCELRYGSCVCCDDERSSWRLANARVTLRQELHLSFLRLSDRPGPLVAS